MATYNANRDGNLLPSGTTVRRRFATDEYELYAADSWRLGPTLTLNAGVRWSLYSPPWETNGMQVDADLSLGDWFDQRAANAAKGIPASAMPLFQYQSVGPGERQGRPLQLGLHERRAARLRGLDARAGRRLAEAADRRQAPRGARRLLAASTTASAPPSSRPTTASANTGVGYSGAFGLTTDISTPFGVGLDVHARRPLHRPERSAARDAPDAAPDVSFPYQPPLESGFIGVGIDGSVRTPYSHVINAVVGRELPGGFSVEAAYVGRFGRRLLVRSDVATPANLVDAKTGVDYFTAAGALIKATQSAGIGVNADPSAYAVLANIPYWENLFPGAAGNGLTATQAVAQLYNTAPDYATALYLLDEVLLPVLQHLRAVRLLQLASSMRSSIQRSIARSNYHALQVSVRKRWSRGYQFDVNYTLSQSEDLGSSVERGSSWMTPGYGRNVRHAREPLGAGAAVGDVPTSTSGTSSISTGWPACRSGAARPGAPTRRVSSTPSSETGAYAGLLRLTSGFPFNVANCALCWATNWNLMGNAELATPGVLPQTAVTKNGPDGWPNAYPDPEAALKYFRMDLPGEVGIRNQLRGDGYFGIDLSVSKAWTLPYGSLRFRWDTFNLTNAVNFDTATVTMYPDRPGFGRYNSTLATCDGRAGRCMQFALHYEF